MVIGDKRNARRGDIARGRAPYVANHRNHQHVYGGVCDGKYRQRRCLTCGGKVYAKGVGHAPQTDAFPMLPGAGDELSYALWGAERRLARLVPTSVRVWARNLYEMALTPTPMELPVGVVAGLALYGTVGLFLAVVFPLPFAIVELYIGFLAVIFAGMVVAGKLLDRWVPAEQSW